jgi:hypothetical protein
VFDIVSLLLVRPSTTFSFWEEPDKKKENGRSHDRTIPLETWEIQNRQ